MGKEVRVFLVFCLIQNGGMDLFLWMTEKRNISMSLGKVGMAARGMGM